MKTVARSLDGCALSGLHSLRSSLDGCALSGLHSLRSCLDGCALPGLHSLRSSLDGCALSGLHSLRSSLDGCALSGLHSLRSWTSLRAPATVRKYPRSGCCSGETSQPHPSASDRCSLWEALCSLRESGAS